MPNNGRCPAKEWVRLKTEVLYGINPVKEALVAGRREIFEVCQAIGKGSSRGEALRQAAESRGVPVRDEAGRILCWAGINLDISKRKQREAMLRQSLRDLEASRSEVKSEQDRLWKLAANAFSLLGEAHLTEEGMRLEYFGDGIPETKIGLMPGAAPKTVAPRSSWPAGSRTPRTHDSCAA